MYLNSMANPVPMAVFVPEACFLKRGHPGGVRKEYRMYLDWDQAERYRGWANRYFTLQEVLI
jgi:hypothetical protein